MNSRGSRGEVGEHQKQNPSPKRDKKKNNKKVSLGILKKNTVAAWINYERQRRRLGKGRKEDDDGVILSLIIKKWGWEGEGGGGTALIVAGEMEEDEASWK